METHSPTDAQLMTAIRDGDEQALRELMERWERPLSEFVYRYLQMNEAVPDITAECFVQIFRNAHRYDPKRRFSSWMFAIAANLCRKHLRWKRRHPEWGQSIDVSATMEEVERSGTGLISADPDPQLAAKKRETAELVRKAVLGMKHDLKVALILRYYEDLSYAEISEILGCSTRGVESRLYRARQKLKQLLAQNPSAVSPGGRNLQFLPLKGKRTDPLF